MTEQYDVEDLGFEPAVSATGASEARTPRAKPSRRARGGRVGSLRQRIGSFVILGTALGVMGSAYAVFATSSSAENSSYAGSSDAGAKLYSTSCITCHGANLQGVEGRGPSLAGVGAAATYFQVSTGRMPASSQGAENYRRPAKFNDEQTRDLAAYIQSVAGGPELPTGDLTLSSDKLSEGGELFRLNCASCHGSTGKGAPLSAGAVAPGLNDASDLQIYTAMLSGPENMPVFGNGTITPEQKKAIVSYIRYLNTANDPGGNGIDRIGPVSEGLVIWILGIGALVVTILWIGARA